MLFLVATTSLPVDRPTGTPHAHAKILAFLVATTSLPAVYRPNGYARTTTAGTPHARANFKLGMYTYKSYLLFLGSVLPPYVASFVCS